MVLTVLGIAVFSGLALRLENRRDTDLRDASSAVTRYEEASTDREVPSIRFVDVAAGSGLIMRHGPGKRSRNLTEDTGSGIAWGDVDGDGDFDLYAVNFAGEWGQAPSPEGGNRLFLNLGDGNFEDVTSIAGVEDLEGFGMGASFADYDADGDLDLYVTNAGPNRLFRNRGDGTFEDEAVSAGVADELWSTGAAWGDYDRDGHLDLYSVNYLRYLEAGAMAGTETERDDQAIPYTLNPSAFDPQPNRLYRNRGDGTFEDVAVALGVDDPGGRGLSASFADLDGDGWLDIYVNNDVSPNKLFRNDGGDAPEGSAASFVDFSTVTGTADPRGSMGLSLVDLGIGGTEPDGLPELFITHWAAQENALYESVRRTSDTWEYRDRTRELRLGEVSVDNVGWGSAFVDLDLDGNPDIAVANGSTLEDREDASRLRAERMFLFWNDGERFIDVAHDAGEDPAAAHQGRGLAAADYDADGDVDLAISVNRGAPLLLRNDTETGHASLALRLDAPDAIAFGSMVELTVAGRVQRRWWGSDVGYLGNHAAEMIFGLGRAEQAERLRVRWADGRETVRKAIPAGRVTLVWPEGG